LGLRFQGRLDGAPCQFDGDARRLEVMVKFPAGLCIAYRKPIVPFLGRFWIEPLQALLNMLIAKNMDSILAPYIRNNLGPKLPPLPSGRTLNDDVRAFFMVPIPAKNIMSSLNPLACVLKMNSKFRTRYSVVPKGDQLVQA